MPGTRRLCLMNLFLHNIGDVVGEPPVERADALIARDKASLDVFWLEDDSLDNLDDLPPPEVLQQEIIDHLEAALAAFRDVAAGLQR